MRILVYEFVSGGGCAGRAVPASLVREGLAMRTALVADLAAIGCCRVVTTTDVRFERAVPPGVEVVKLLPGDTSVLDALVVSADAVWLVAPETNRCLERLVASSERKGKILLGSSSAAIRKASDKAGLPRRLARMAVQHPDTVTLLPGMDARVVGREIGYPVIVKPVRGAGSQGVQLARNGQELRSALAAIQDAWGVTSRATVNRAVERDVVIQRYVPGTPASVSLVADGRRAVALAVSGQSVRASSGFSYRGGRTPLRHPQATAAVDAAVRACAAFPGLRGYVGVDVLLTEPGPLVIEVNPRLTTSYLGVRAVLDENVAELAMAACNGVLPARPIARRRVRFTVSGQVAAA